MILCVCVGNCAGEGVGGLAKPCYVVQEVVTAIGSKAILHHELNKHQMLTRETYEE